MFGLGLIASLGGGIIKSLIADKGEDLVKQGIKKATGIDLDAKSELSKEEIKKIEDNLKAIQRETELIYQDKQGARNMAMSIATSGKDWLVRNTGSMIAIFTVLSAFALDMTILIMIFNDLDVNSMLTLIAGANNVKASQVLSFYFGSSKNEADSKRG